MKLVVKKYIKPYKSKLGLRVKLINSLENKLLPKKNDIVIIRWKPKLIANDNSAIFLVISIPVQFYYS